MKIFNAAARGVRNAILPSVDSADLLGESEESPPVRRTPGLRLNEDGTTIDVNQLDDHRTQVDLADSRTFWENTRETPGPYCRR